jgi:hypothetical protein
MDDPRRYPSSDDGRQPSESSNWPYHSQQPEPWGDESQSPVHWEDRQWQPAPAEYHSQAHEWPGASARQDPWAESGEYQNSPRNGQYPQANGNDNRSAVGQSARGRDEDAWVYREPHQANQVQMSRTWTDATRQQVSAPRREETWQDGGRPQPGAAPQGTPPGPEFSLGWVFAVAVSTLLGLGVVWMADKKASDSGNVVSAVELLFVGLIIVFAPLATRILSRKTASMERFALVILLGLAFYTVKILAGPTSFIYNDEFIHLRNTENILSSGHLFQYNPLLPTAGYYPGLAAVTATLVNLTGLSTFVCGLIIIGVGRVVISASLYFVAEKVTGSSRGAGVASLLYATNSMFLFWSAQFAYEDLALPLAAFAVWWLTRTRGLRGRIAAQAITVIAIVAVAVTHHVSAFVLCAILSALYIAECIFAYPSARRRYVGIFAVLTGILASFWFFVVAKPAADYLLGQNVVPAVQGMLSVITGSGGQRQLYGGDSTSSPPSWYVYAGFLAILIIMAALLPAIIRAWRILRARGLASIMPRRASVAVAAICAIAFPFTLLPRLTGTGTALSARTSELVFTAIGCSIGLLWEEFGNSKYSGTLRTSRLVRFDRAGTLFIASLLSLVLVGQVSVSTSFYTILPTTTVGFPVYVQPYMISAAEWSHQHLGADQTFATDNDNTLTLAGYGEEDPQQVGDIWPIFYSATMDSVVIDTIKKEDIHYVLLDWLATKDAPVKPGGVYYSSLEPIDSLHGGALPKSYYSKFYTYTCSRKVYQSGTIQIYDVSQIAKGGCVPHPIGSVAGKASSGEKSATKQKAS